MKIWMSSSRGFPAKETRELEKYHELYFPFSSQPRLAGAVWWREMNDCQLGVFIAPAPYQFTEIGLFLGWARHIIIAGERPSSSPLLHMPWIVSVPDRDNEIMDAIWEKARFLDVRLNNHLQVSGQPSSPPALANAPAQGEEGPPPPGGDAETDGGV